MGTRSMTPGPRNPAVGPSTLTAPTRRGGDRLFSWPQRVFAIGLVLLLALTGFQAARAFAASEQAAGATTGAQTTTLLIGFTQRESLATLVEADQWLLGQASRRDLQLARALLERRLDTVDGEGVSAHDLVGDEYHAALDRLDAAWSDAPPGILPSEARAAAASRVEPAIVEFTEQSKFLTDRYQQFADQVLASTSGESRRQTQLLLLTLAVTLAAALVLLVWVARDVRSRYRSAAILEYRATHDSLTGLVNRHEILERIHGAIRDDRLPGSIALLFIDLDGFKQINDTHGHKTGDHVLIEVGARLQTFLAPEPDRVVGRLGGDEFVILCPRVEDASEIEALAMQAILEVSRPIVVDGVTTSVGASVGIALMDPETASPEDLMRNADLAMYRAKHVGDGGFHVHCEEPDGTAVTDPPTQLRRRRAYRDADGTGPNGAGESGTADRVRLDPADTLDH
jgi:diguanylate cyclase (GGDEF)-like protein